MRKSKCLEMHRKVVIMTTATMIEKSAGVKSVVGVSANETVDGEEGLVEQLRNKMANKRFPNGQLFYIDKQVLLSSPESSCRVSTSKLRVCFEGSGDESFGLGEYGKHSFALGTELACNELLVFILKMGASDMEISQRENSRIHCAVICE